MFTGVLSPEGLAALAVLTKSEPIKVEPLDRLRSPTAEIFSPSLQHLSPGTQLGLFCGGGARTRTDVNPTCIMARSYGFFPARAKRNDETIQTRVAHIRRSRGIRTASSFTDEASFMGLVTPTETLRRRVNGGAEMQASTPSRRPPVSCSPRRKRCIYRYRVPGRPRGCSGSSQQARH